jgi:opacity protein-like surface antigen
MALCLSTTTGRAQGYKFFIMGSDSVFTDQNSFSESYIPYKSSYAGGAKVIVGVEAPFYKIFGIEGSWGIGSNNLEINNTSYSYSLIHAYGVRNNRLSADIVGHVPGVWRGIRAYGVVGVEYDLFSPTNSALTLAKTQGFAGRVATLSSQGEDGYNVGGGLDYKVASKVDLRIDVRDHFFGSPTYGLPQAATSASSAYFPISGSAHDIEYSIGFVYRFGKSK